MQSEQELISRAGHGDQRAYRMLYETHVTPLFRFLKQFSSDRDEVADWVQRAYIKAFERLAGFDGRVKFSTWLFAIALNEMKMDRRRHSIISFLPLEPELHGNGEENPEADFVWNEHLKTLLEGLDEAKRMVFVLSEVEGYSHSEISFTLGIEEGSSRSLLSRAKSMLRQRYVELEKQRS